MMCVYWGGSRAAQLLTVIMSIQSISRVDVRHPHPLSQTPHRKCRCSVLCMSVHAVDNPNYLVTDVMFALHVSLSIANVSDFRTI